MAQPEPTPAAPAPPPMAEPTAPAPAPVQPAPAQPAPAPAPVQATIPRPENGAGAIIGGSILTGLGGAIVFGAGIGCAIVCGSDADTRPLLLGVMAGGAAAVGGGIGLEVVGFQRFERALVLERQYNIQAAATPRQIGLGAMLGGLFAASFFGLISGGITRSIYKRKWTEARLPPPPVAIEPGWSPLLGRGTRGVALGGRF